VKIITISINGFKNVRDTYLDFQDNPIIVLLAPNNYGKTNLLQGIQEGFGLIRKQGTEVVDYIRNRSYVDKFPSGKDVLPFTFEVEFLKRTTEMCSDERQYHYKVVIDGSLNNPEDSKSAKGITTEFLKYSVVHRDKENQAIKSPPITLFERDTEDSSVAKFPCLTGNRRANIKHSSFDKDDKSDEDIRLYPAEWYLFLHKLGNMAIIDGANKNDTELTVVLKEIAGVLTSLTRENIGMIIADEDSDYRSPVKLAREAQSLKLENETEYRHFEESFCNMFPQYKKFSLLQVSNERFELLFEDQHKHEDTMTLSYGTRRTFKLLSQICANKTPLVSLEELETGLHPSLYRNVLHAFFQSIDEDLYNRRNADTPGNKKRKNEPKLIISSHAPALVNRFDKYLNAVYIGVPSYCENGWASFKHLNKKGEKEIIEMIYKNEGALGIGDIIFQLFFDKYSKQTIEEDWLQDE
jgi:AAA15 family ATPase/GTPase